MLGQKTAKPYRTRKAPNLSARWDQTRKIGYPFTVEQRAILVVEDHPLIAIGRRRRVAGIASFRMSAHYHSNNHLRVYEMPATC